MYVTGTSSVIEGVARNLYEDDPYICNCNNVCNRVTGRGACPCRKASRKCSRLCTCGTKKLSCKNRSVISTRMQGESDSDDSSEVEPVYSFIDDSSDEEILAEQTPPRQKAGRKNTKRKASTKQTTRKKSKKTTASGRTSQQTPATPRTASPEQALEAEDVPIRDAVRQEMDNQNEAIREYLDSMETQELRELCFNLIGRHPDEWERLRENVPDEHPDQGNEPGWCHCGNCREMRTETENVCCRRRAGPCVTSQAQFRNLILDPESLDLAMALRRWLLLLGDRPSNNNYRHAGYRNFVFWREGNPGRYNRIVIPSCAVWAIRDRYPSPDCHYTGFKFHRF